MIKENNHAVFGTLLSKVTLVMLSMARKSKYFPCSGPQSYDHLQSKDKDIAVNFSNNLCMKYSIIT